MDHRAQQIGDECERQEETCRYTAATIFEWLKSLRRWRGVFVIVPVVAGAIASWQVIGDDPIGKWVASACALLAGIATAVYKALDFDVSLDGLAKAAHQYKVLQDRFRQARLISTQGEREPLEREFRELMDRLDAVRAMSLTPPERFFKAAQLKVKSGDYAFTVDEKRTIP